MKAKEKRYALTLTPQEYATIKKFVDLMRDTNDEEFDSLLLEMRRQFALLKKKPAA